MRPAVSALPPRLALAALAAGALAPSPTPLPTPGFFVVSLPDGRVGELYETTVASAPGGAAQFFVVGGGLPPGLRLETTGTLRGTPSEVGTFEFSVGATTPLGSFGKVYELTIQGPPPLELVPQALPDAELGIEYCDRGGARLEATGGTPPYTFGAAPPRTEFTVESNGVLCGVPRSVGIVDVGVVVRDREGRETRGLFSIFVFPPGRTTLAILTTELPDGVVRQRYDAQLEARSDYPPLTWRISEGRLPGGLRLEPNGRLFGVPEDPGTFVFEVEAQDPTGQQQLALSLTIAAEPPIIEPPNTGGIDQSGELAGVQDVGCRCGPSPRERPWAGAVALVLALFGLLRPNRRARRSASGA